ncbi:Gfo/Idh/MocA family oxidoreductase [Rhizobium terrae]|uniref:Gfo/Idh/MocA family oxidoreductase n=1 Tax=Rhizobium terrae TaxID=2171756 RepID=UPI001D0269BB
MGAATITKERMCSAFRSHPQAEVAALYGSDAERTRQFAEDMEVPAWDTGLDRFLKGNDLDTVYIASTNDKHCNQT